MPSSTNQLTIVLGIADNKLRAGVKRAQAHLMGLERSLNRTGAAGTRAGAQINAGAKVAKNGIGDARKGMARFTESVRTSIVNMKFLAGLLAGGALTKGIVSFSATYEKSIASLNTLLVKSSVSAQEYSNQRKGLAASTPKDLIGLSSALYQIISAGVPAVNRAGGAFDVLTKSTKLAVSSLSETKQAANLLITTMNAYKGTTLSTGQATDKLTRIYQLGRTTVGELSTSFGRAATIASQFGVSMDETGAMLISLTRAGLNTNEAITATRAIMSGMAKPTQKTQKILKALGVEFGQGAIEAHGFTGVLEQLMNAAGGNVDVLARLFPNIRALLPAVVTVGAGFDEFKGHVDELKNSFGATDAAVEKTDQKFFKSAALLKSNFQNVLVEMGEDLLPVLMDKFDRLSEFLQSTEGAEFAETLGSLLVQMVELTSVFAKAIGAGVKPFIEIFERFGGVIASGLKIAVISKALLMLQATFTAFGTRMKAIGAAAGAGAGNAFGAGLLTRAGVAINGLFARMSPRLLAAGTKMGAFIGRGVATGIAAANIGMAVLKSLLGIGGIVFMISALVSTFFSEAEEEAKEQARTTRINVQKEIEELRKQRAKAFKERTGKTAEELQDLKGRAVTGTVVQLTKEERLRSISAPGIEGEFDLGAIVPGMKSGEAFMEAREVYQGLVKQFTRLLPEDERQTQAGLRKAQNAAFGAWEKLIQDRIKTSTDTLQAFVSTGGAGDPAALEKRLKDSLDSFGKNYFSAITDTSSRVAERSNRILDLESKKIIALTEVDRLIENAAAQKKFDDIRKQLIFQARTVGVQDTVLSPGYEQAGRMVPEGTRLPRGLLTPESVFEQEKVFRGMFFSPEDREAGLDRGAHGRYFRPEMSPEFMDRGRRSLNDMLNLEVGKQIEKDLDGTFLAYLNFVRNLIETEGRETEAGRAATKWMEEYKKLYVDAQIETRGSIASSQREVFDEATQGAIKDFKQLVQEYSNLDVESGAPGKPVDSEAISRLKEISGRITDGAVKSQVDGMISAIERVDTEMKEFVEDPTSVISKTLRESQSRLKDPEAIQVAADLALDRFVAGLRTSALEGRGALYEIDAVESQFRVPGDVARLAGGVPALGMMEGPGFGAFGGPDSIFYGDLQSLKKEFGDAGELVDRFRQDIRTVSGKIDFKEGREEILSAIKSLESYQDIVKRLQSDPLFAERFMGDPKQFLRSVESARTELQGLQEQLEAITITPIRLDKANENRPIYGVEVDDADSPGGKKMERLARGQSKDDVEGAVIIDSVLDVPQGFAGPGQRVNAPQFAFKDFVPDTDLSVSERFGREDPEALEALRGSINKIDALIEELKSGTLTSAPEIEAKLGQLQDLTIGIEGQEMPPWLQQYSDFLAGVASEQAEEKLSDDDPAVQALGEAQKNLQDFLSAYRTVSANITTALTKTEDFEAYRNLNEQIERSRSIIASVTKLQDLRQKKGKDFLSLAGSVLNVMKLQNIEGSKAAADAERRRAALQGIVDRQKKSNEAATKVPKTRGGRGRDYNRAFNRAIDRLIDKTEKTRIKNSITLAQLDVSRNKSIQKRIGLIRKEFMVGRSWYGEQKELLKEILGSYDDERKAIEASVEAERGLYEARKQAAQDQFDRETKSERLRLKRLLRGNAARGSRGKANRKKMEDALDKFSKERAIKRDAAISKLDDKYEQQSEARIRKLRSVDRNIAKTRQKQLQGILKEITDANQMIQEQLNLAFKRSDRADSLGKFLEVQREILRLSVQSTENLKEQIRLKQRQASESVKQDTRILELQEKLKEAILVEKSERELLADMGITGRGFGEIDIGILRGVAVAAENVTKIRSDIAKERSRIRAGESFRQTQRDIESLRRQSEDSERQMQDETRRRVVSFIASMRDGSDTVSSRVESAYAKGDTSPFCSVNRKPKGTNQA